MNLDILLSKKSKSKGICRCDEIFKGEMKTSFRAYQRNYVKEQLVVFLGPQNGKLHSK